jgi:two-component system NarL family sensor kinase
VTRALTPVSVPRAVGAFLLAGLLVLLALAAVLSVAQRRIAVTEAIRDARTLTDLEAHDVAGWALTDEALVPGTEAHRLLDQVVRERVLGELIVRVKIWDETGRVVYSDDRALIGQRFVLAQDEQEAMRSKEIVAEVSDLGEDENVGEAQFGRLLQVYLGMTTTTGTPLLFETYQPYDTIEDASRRMWLGSLPALVGGLVLLYGVQAPLAYRMARRLRAAQEEREQLLVGALAASDRERSRIAADLHDGVVQGLAGASYTLSAAAEQLRGTAQEQTVRSTALDLRRWVRELRSLLVTVTPPGLHSAGLATTVADLVASLEGRGLVVTLDVGELPDLPDDVEALAYRVAQEAVRNVVRHADAARVRVSLHVEPPGTLLLEVADDGRGFDPAGVSRRHGSVGLELLTSVVAAQHGRLEVVSSPELGTSVTLTVALPTTSRRRTPVPTGADS